MQKPKKIIWIVLDTLRADHLGCYGYKRNTSPNIDALAGESIFFQWSFSTCSYTMPSHASMFTSKYPSKHSTGFSNDVPVAPIDNDIFLAEILSSSGYETGAFVSSLVLSRERRVGISSGFKMYDDTMTGPELNRPEELIRSGDETNSEVFTWLEENHRKDLFLFVNYFDIHGPYLNPKPYNESFVHDAFYGDPQYIERLDLYYDPLGCIPEYQILRPVRNDKDELLSYEKDLRYYIAQYDGGIRYIDDRVRDLIEELKRLGIYDDSLIVVTSDHGEALGENNVYFFHGLTVTPDQIYVPLLIKPHKDWCLCSKIVDTHVSSIDIMPTLLDLIDVDYRELDLEGTSLITLIEKAGDERLDRRVLMAEIEGQTAYIDESLIEVKSIPAKDKNTKFRYFRVDELCNKEISCQYRDTGGNTAREWIGKGYVPGTGRADKLAAALQTREIHIRDLQAILDTKDRHIQNLQAMIGPLRDAIQQELEELRKMIVPRGVSPEEALGSGPLRYPPPLGEQDLRVQDSWKGDGKSKCSIVILTYNRVEYTRQCLEALIQNTPDALYEVIIVDNGSTDGTKEFLKSLEGDVRIITNQTNLGFSRGCNQGARAASGEYLVFLNNDTIPQPGWLEELVKAAEQDIHVGIVGSKLLFPDRKIQHAGVVICGDGQPRHIYYEFDSDHPSVNKKREFQIVTGACMLIKREFFLKLGCFDEEFRNGYEDVDLCLRCRKEGYKVIYNPGSVLYHYRALSKAPDHGDVDISNYELLCKKWPHLEQDDYKYYREDGLEISMSNFRG